MGREWVGERGSLPAGWSIGFNVMPEWSHWPVLSTNFRKKVACFPTIPTIFTPIIRSIFNISAAASHLFQTYSHSRRQLTNGSAGAPSISTFLLIVEFYYCVF
jgi:hypothetical protein